MSSFAMIAAESRGVGYKHLGVDAVTVHLVEPGRGVVTAGADVLEPDPALHVLGREARARVHAEVDGIAHAFDDPRVALVEALDAGRPVAERGGNPIEPEIRRFVHVAVGGDELIRAELVSTGR